MIERCRRSRCRRRSRASAAIRSPTRAAPATSAAASRCGAASASRSATRTSPTARASTTPPRRRSRCARARTGPVASIRTAAVDYGQGLYTVLAQIVRSELGVEEVVVEPADDRERLGRLDLRVAADDDDRRRGARRLRARSSRSSAKRRPRRSRSRARPRTTTARRPSSTSDGQGDIHVAFSFVAERAVVEVDAELGLVRVVQIAAAQDAGRVINPQGARARSRAARRWGSGSPLMEELQVEDGEHPQRLVHRLSDPDDPRRAADRDRVRRGARAGRALRREGHRRARRRSSRPPAVVAALRAATGRTLNRVPVTPDDLVGLRPPAATTGPAPVPDVPASRRFPSTSASGSGSRNS